MDAGKTSFGSLVVRKATGFLGIGVTHLDGDSRKSVWRVQDWVREREDGRFWSSWKFEILYDLYSRYLFHLLIVMVSNNGIIFFIFSTAVLFIVNIFADTTVLMMQGKRKRNLLKFGEYPIFFSYENNYIGNSTKSCTFSYEKAVAIKRSITVNIHYTYNIFSTTVLLIKNISVNTTFEIIRFQTLKNQFLWRIIGNDI